MILIFLGLKRIFQTLILIFYRLILIFDLDQFQSDLLQLCAQDADAASVVHLARSGAESSRVRGETMIVTVASSGPFRSSQLNTNIFHFNRILSV